MYTYMCVHIIYIYRYRYVYTLEYIHGTRNMAYHLKGVLIDTHPTLCGTGASDLHI